MPDRPPITWDELLECLPDDLRVVALEYADALLSLTTGEITAWVELHLLGRSEDAYKSLLARMSSQELSAVGDRLAASWRRQNQENAAHLEMHWSTLKAIFRIGLRLLLLRAGLPTDVAPREGG